MIVLLNTVGAAGLRNGAAAKAALSTVFLPKGQATARLARVRKTPRPGFGRGAGAKTPYQNRL